MLRLFHSRPGCAGRECEAAEAFSQATRQRSRRHLWESIFLKSLLGDRGVAERTRSVPILRSVLASEKQKQQLMRRSDIAPPLQFAAEACAEENALPFVAFCKQLEELPDCLLI